MVIRVMKMDRKNLCTHKKQKAFFFPCMAAKREKKKLTLFREKEETHSPKKVTEPITHHHHVSQFVRCSSDGNSHAVKCTRDVENTR